MSTNDDNPTYRYHSGDYNPSLGNLSGTDDSDDSSNRGYYDEVGLRNQLTQIIDATTKIIEAAEKSIKDYSLKIEPNSKLHQAQIQEWPSNMGEPKLYVSFEEYKALERVQSRGSEYIRKVYEEYIRGSFGTNAIDIISLSNSLRVEAKNIVSFLDKYLGVVNDSSEYRTLESLQDWAEIGVKHAANIAVLFSKGIENSVQIPATELDQIGEADARSYQAFFQTKINAVNKEIKQYLEDLNKEYNTNSEIFYDKFLGPSLKFRLQFGRTLENNYGVGFLANQAMQADQAMSANHMSLLADQMKRNESFQDRMEDVLARVYARDNYARYSKQLNSKLEKETKSPFIKTEITEEELDGYKDFTTQIIAKEEAVNTFTSAHSLIDGRDAPDAHEQYLLKAGDTITGDISVEDGIKIDGVDLDVHRHRGVDVDGTPKIKGSDIEDLVTTAIKKDEDICYPVNLRHINNRPYTGTNNVTLVNSQIAWDCDPDMTFELQTVPVTTTAIPAVVELDWCVTTLYETALPIVAGLGSDFNFFTFCTPTAVYNYNWTTGILTTIAGSEGNYGDGPYGDSIIRARFSNIKDLAQDFYDGRIYIADGDNRKVKMTGKATTAGHSLPMDVTTVFSCPYNIKRLDTQGQNFLNTLYVVAGPDGGGKDRVYKLVDTDGNNLASGTYGSTEITKLSGVYSDIIDIAATPNGFVYLLKGTTLYQYDPNIDTVKPFDVADDVGTAIPTAITSDQFNNIYITYSTISEYDG